jgi:hypothetical protein
MSDIKAVYSSDAFSLVKEPSSAIARDSSIAEYGHPPASFHHIVSHQARLGAAACATRVRLIITLIDVCGARRRRGMGIQALAPATCHCVYARSDLRPLGAGLTCELGRRGKNP